MLGPEDIIPPVDNTDSARPYKTNVSHPLVYPQLCIRGLFERECKALIRDIKEEAGNVICFIDEVQPALARGLQLVGCITCKDVPPGWKLLIPGQSPCRVPY
ncbi:hypothetical protein MPER_04371 [Moniliophthora perniciosa FA553]|nr:hypothetical protein MPER_04371 [Moniliophthora perniciosa FA553]